MPKSGTTLLVLYLQACGLELEPGGLVADDGDLMMADGKPWRQVRLLADVLGHHAHDRVIGGHVRAGIDLRPHRVAMIIRHPRNVLVSWARWIAVERDWSRSREPSRSAVLRTMLDPDHVAFLIARLRRFEGWCGRADVTVRFVDFFERPHDTALLLADRLGLAPADPVKVLGDAAPWVTPSYRGTWSGRNSDWREIWTDGLDALWSQCGGPEVEAMYGYGAS